MALKLIVFTLFFAAVFQVAQLQIGKMEKCPKNIVPVKSFDANAFEGCWYEAYRYPTLVMSGSCVQYCYSAKNGETIKIKQVIPQSNNTVSVSEVSDFKQKGDKKKPDGVMEYDTVIGLAKARTNLTVIATDYKTFAVLYTCGTFFDFSMMHGAYILSRTANITEATLAKAQKTLDDLKIDRTPLTKSYQDNCN